MKRAIGTRLEQVPLRLAVRYQTQAGSAMLSAAAKQAML
jgi:hypothetical protein